jgi:hypothetical protein
MFANVIYCRPLDRPAGQPFSDEYHHGLPEIWGEARFRSLNLRPALGHVTRLRDTSHGSIIMFNVYNYMNALIKMLESLGYIIITSNGGTIKSVMMTRKMGSRESLCPPSIILTKIGNTSFIDIKIYYDGRQELDSPLIPVITQQFGLNYMQDDRYCVIFYRLFDSGYSEKYLKHVLNNLGSCLIALIQKTAT